MDKYQELKNLIKDAKRIVVFTGAGISVPSGIPDFRSADGLYNEKGYNIPPERIISHSYFFSNTESFYKFYKDKMMYLDAMPNAAHYYFAELQKDKDVRIVTQNIDGLHELAGSTYVYDIHGSIHRNYCLKCHEFYDAKFVKESKGLPICPKCGGLVKPDVVLYEEQLDYDVIERAIEAISRADLLIIVGTSLVVYPAASFVNYFHGNNIVLINKSETPMDGYAKLVFNEDVINVIKKIS